MEGKGRLKVIKRRLKEENSFKIIFWISFIEEVKLCNNVRLWLLDYGNK